MTSSALKLIRPNGEITHHSTFAYAMTCPRRGSLGRGRCPDVPLEMSWQHVAVPDVRPNTLFPRELVWRKEPSGVFKLVGLVPLTADPITSIF